MPRPKGAIDRLWREAEEEARKSYPGYEDSDDEAKRRAFWGTVNKIYAAKEKAHKKDVGVTFSKA